MATPIQSLGSRTRRPNISEFWKKKKKKLFFAGPNIQSHNPRFTKKIIKKFENKLKYARKTSIY